MKLNISAKEFIALYTCLSSRQSSPGDQDHEPLKQVRDRMKAYLVSALTKPSTDEEVNDPQISAWMKWEETQKKRISELESVKEKVEQSSQKEMLIVPTEEVDSPVTYPRKQPPAPTMPKPGGKGHGKRR